MSKLFLYLQIYLFLPFFSLAQEGYLDLNFGVNGKQVTSISPYNDYAEDVVIQPDGKILVGGNSYIGNDLDFTIARYNIDGFLDVNFGIDGIQTVDFNNTKDVGKCFRLQKDGKIIQIGEVGQFDLGLVRYNSNGTLDQSFGNNGKVIILTNTNALSNKIDGITLQTDGKIVIAGQIENGIAIFRFNSDGSPDLSFNKTGMNITNYYSYAFGYDVIVQQDGKILVGGAKSEGSFDFAIWRYNSDGTLDQTFGNSGFQTTDISGSTDAAFKIGLQTDGKIILSGYARIENQAVFALTRYESNGKLDLEFGTEGIQTTKIGNKEDIPNGMVIQEDDKILIAGRSNNGNDFDFVLARYTADGFLDQEFGAGGIQITDFNSLNDIASSVAIQNNDIIVAGWTGGDPWYDFAVAKYKNKSEEENSVVLFEGKLLDDAIDYNDIYYDNLTDITLKVELKPNGIYGSELRTVLTIGEGMNTRLSDGEILFAVPEELKINGSDEKLYLIAENYTTKLYDPNECADGIINSLSSVILSATTTFVPGTEPLDIFLDIFSMGNAFLECNNNTDIYNDAGIKKNSYKFIAKPYSIDPILGKHFYNKFEHITYLENDIAEVLGLIKAKPIDIVLVQQFTHAQDGGFYASSVFYEKRIEYNEEVIPTLVDFLVYQDGGQLHLEWKNPTDFEYDEIKILVNGNEFDGIENNTNKYTLRNLRQGYYKIGLVGMKGGKPSKINSQIVAYFDEYDGSVLGTWILDSEKEIAFNYEDWGLSGQNYANYFNELYDFKVKVLPYEASDKSVIECEIILKNLDRENNSERMGAGTYLISLPNEIETIDSEIKLYLTDLQQTWQYTHDGCLNLWWNIIFDKIPGVGLLTSFSNLFESIEDCNESNTIGDTEFEDIHGHRTYVGDWGYDYQFANFTGAKILIPINMNYVKAASILAEHKMAINYQFYGLNSLFDNGHFAEITVGGLKPKLNENSIAYDSKSINATGSYKFDNEQTGISLEVSSIEGSGEIRVKRVASITNDFVELTGANPLPQTWDINVESSIQKIKTDLIFSINDLGIENFEENSTSIGLYKKTEEDSVYKFYSNVDYNNNGTSGDMSDDYLLVEGITSFSKFILAGEGILTDIDNSQRNDVLPTTFSLYQNYPNPFNPTTTITYSLPKQVFVNLKLYDILGREIRTLVNEIKKTGTYSIEINGADLSSGIYFYKLQAGDFVDTKKMILLK